MAGQPGQPKYGSGWPDGLLAGLEQPGHREARPLVYNKKKYKGTGVTFNKIPSNFVRHILT